MNYKYLSFALLSTFVIVSISSIPDQNFWGNGALCKRIISNLAHIPAYALLSFLWLKSFAGSTSRNHIITRSFILGGLVLFAISDEFHQSFVPGRSASFMDIGLDLIGIILGLGAFITFRTFSISQLR